MSEQFENFWKFHNPDNMDKHVVKLINHLGAENKRLREQELCGIETTLDMLIDKADQEKWGLEQLEHPRNVQHIFMRLCTAFNELNESQK